MKLKKLLLLPLALSLSACVIKQAGPAPTALSTYDANIKIAEAARSVSHSLIELAEIQEAATPPLHVKKLTDPTFHDMQQITSVDWAGPIHDIVFKLANISHYRVRVLGTPPAIPVLISITAKDTALASILRDVDFQAGDRADLAVYPHQKVIELRYARS